MPDSPRTDAPKAAHGLRSPTNVRWLLSALAVCVVAGLVPPASFAVPRASELTPAQRERLSNIGGQRPREAGPLTPAQAHQLLLGLSELHHDRPQRALDALRPLIEEEGRLDEWVLNSYGAALLEAGEAGAAERVLGRALGRYPRNGYLHLNLAWALSDQGRDIEALPHLDSYLGSEMAARDPRMQRRAYLALAHGHIRSGRVDEREIVLQAALNSFPNDPWFAELLAEAAFDRGDDAEFRRLAQQAVRAYVAHHRLPTGDENDESKTWEASGTYRLPLNGPALVRRGFESDPGHRGLRMRYAVELWPLDEQLRPRPEGVSLQGSPVRQWVGFGQPVVAARRGVILAAEDAHPDRTHTGLPEGLPFAPVNYLVLHHADDDEVSVYRHVQQHSIRALGLAVGDTVERGAPLGAVGCNGTRTAFPRLTFHVARYREDGLHLGLAYRFADVEHFADYAWQARPFHSPQAGDTLRPVR